MTQLSVDRLPQRLFLTIIRRPTTVNLRPKISNFLAVDLEPIDTRRVSPNDRSFDLLPSVEAICRTNNVPDLHPIIDHL